MSGRILHGISTVTAAFAGWSALCEVRRRPQAFSCPVPAVHHTLAPRCASRAPQFFPSIYWFWFDPESGWKERYIMLPALLLVLVLPPLLLEVGPRPAPHAPSRTKFAAHVAFTRRSVL